MGLFSRRDDENWNPPWWSTRCKSDPRFDMSGEATGTFDAMRKCDEAIIAKAKELGIEPPNDIEISGGKS